MCPSCGSFYPYPKQYPGNPSLQKTYQAVLDWCHEKATARESIDNAVSKLNSIIEANRDLVGLPGLEKDDIISGTVAPIWDAIHSLENELEKRKGGRPRKFCRKCQNKVVKGMEFCESHQPGE